MTPYTIGAFQSMPKVIFGMNSTDGVGEEVKSLGGKRIVVVTDPTLTKSGVHEPVITSLRRAKAEYAIFEAVVPDPPIGVVTECTAFVKENKADFVVGLGGGSCLDVAKAASIMCVNSGSIRDYAGVNLVPRAGLPFILIPTTAGTGSEVTSISVLSDTENKVKVGVVSNHMFAELAILDPALTLGMPPHITAQTGLDALIHALESYTGKQATFLTEPLALSAIKLIAKSLRLACADGSNIQARTEMLYASALAGMAFANTQTAGAHACALSLGGAFHVPHGVATSLMLPAIMEFNYVANLEKFSQIALAFGEHIQGLSPVEAAEKAVKAVVRLIKDVGVQMGLENYGVPESAIPDLAKGAMVAARLWQNNPRTATVEQVEEIFRRSFSR